MTRAVFVTGASGFLGGELARSFARDGWRVHALARRDSKLDGLAGLECEVHAGDLTDRASLDRALESVARASERPTIVHCAAVISYRPRDRELQRAVNVEGTQNLLDSARRRPVGRVLHVSSVVAVGHAPSVDRPLDEDAVFNGEELAVDYVTTKRAAEELALAACDALDLVVVNPGAIFGPGGAGANTLRFLNHVAGAMLPFAPPGSISPVSIEDTARGCRLALERGRRGRRYILVESALTLRDTFELAARILGRERAIRVPPRALWRVAQLGASAIDRLTALDGLTPQSMRMLGRHFAFDAARAKRELGWTTEPFESVLRRTVSWARAKSLVP